MTEMGPLGEQPFMATAGRGRGPDGGEGVTELLTGDADHQGATRAQMPAVDGRPGLWIAGTAGQEPMN